MERTHINQTCKCEICSFHTNSKFNLERHVKRMHNNKYASEKCEVCDIVFSNKSNLQKHMKTHSAKMIKCNLCEVAEDTHEKNAFRRKCVDKMYFV